MAWRKKSKKNAPIVQMSDEDVEALEERTNELLHSKLPLGRVKKVIKLNPDIEMVNSEALQMMTKAAEMFIKELSDAANQMAAMERRKTVQPKDIDKVIKKNWSFAFLEDALDGWPKMEPKKRKAATQGEEGDQTVMEETIVEEEEEHEEEIEEEVDENEEEELPETVPEEEIAEKDDEASTPMRDPFAEQF
ncbi:unnamed protein product [Caenorhabditis brenneri]